MKQKKKYLLAVSKGLPLLQYTTPKRKIEKSHRKLLTKLQPILNVSLQLTRHGQIADPLGNLLVVRLQIVVDVAEFLHDAGDVADLTAAGAAGRQV